ncbi:putative dihydrodipicolinate synthetase family protein [Zalerion maritima]|uniref:Dihydrodipicolinate synthetase family protein n=1 Tax=Zalerion maritima TaxID=339359 RepID=A0AAD5RYG7_9PEZI|nr:putative dihydrodipicolinate synthetase family protein [Zalerion maritima]
MPVSSPPVGAYVPVPSFFTSLSACSASEPVARIDVETQTKHALFLARAGIRGLVMMGSTGEAIHLTPCRTQGPRRRRKGGGLEENGFPSYPIMAGVLTNSVEECLDGLQDMKEAGALWGLVLTPGYFGANATHPRMKEWFKIIADRSLLPIFMLVSRLPSMDEIVLCAKGGMVDDRR